MVRFTSELHKYNVMGFDKTILMCTSSNNSFYVYPLISISILELELDEKKEKKNNRPRVWTAAHTHGGCGHAFHDLPPRDFSHARIHALRAARARGRCSVLYVHACVSIERSQPLPISLFPSFRIYRLLSAYSFLEYE